MCMSNTTNTTLRNATVHVVSEKGVISDSILIRVVGPGWAVPATIPNNEESWKTLKGLDDRDDVDVVWRLEDLDGSVVEETPFRLSPPYTHRWGRRSHS